MTLYREFQPSEKLRPFVQCYWAIETSIGLGGNSSHQVLPDGCMDILFDLKASTAEVIGTMTTSMEVPIGGGLNLFAIRFNPGGAHPFLGVSAVELTDKAIEGRTVAGQWGEELHQELLSRRSTRDRIVYLDYALRAKLADSRDCDTTFLTFVSKVIRSPSPTHKVADVLSSVGMSQRTLERYFQKRVGLTAKMFLRILRFRRLVGDGYSSENNESWADLAAKYGYHDQAHLIHEFKEITGKAPNQFKLNDPTLSDFYNTDE